jgi:hypothetical protein
LKAPSVDVEVSRSSLHIPTCAHASTLKRCEHELAKEFVQRVPKGLVAASCWFRATWLVLGG